MLTQLNKEQIMKEHRERHKEYYALMKKRTSQDKVTIDITAEGIENLNSMISSRIAVNDNARSSLSEFMATHFLG